MYETFIKLCKEKNRFAENGDDDLKQLSFYIHEFLLKKIPQLMLVTHPAAFSDPSANSYVSPIFFKGERINDGLLKSGNVKCECEFDILGNSQYSVEKKFLGLPLSNHKSLLMNILEKSPEGIEFCNGLKLNIDELSAQFGQIIRKNDVQFTSGRIQQVYWRLNQHQYQMLSPLVPSLILHEMKNRISEVRNKEFEAKAELKKLKMKDQDYCISYRRLPNLAVVGFGGANPVNISFLNNDCHGSYYLLPCLPPIVKKNQITMPNRDFFNECLSTEKVKNELYCLGRYFRMAGSENCPIPLEKQKKYRDRNLTGIMNYVYCTALNIVLSGNSLSDHLDNTQAKWFADLNSYLKDFSWQEELCNQAARWIIYKCKRICKKKLSLGDAEFNEISRFIFEHKEQWL